MSQTVFLKAIEAPTFLNSLPIRRFSVEEYHRIVEAGILDEDERVELIDGRILKMSPIGSQHAAYVSFLNRKLRPLEEAAIVRIQDRSSWMMKRNHSRILPLLNSRRMPMRTLIRAPRMCCYLWKWLIHPWKKTD